ncbi:nucleotide-binding domain-containing protein [Amylocystis lapponica]|nr:nucleotide-binding domain-containing protein [Amylocystis lapponica]
MPSTVVLGAGIIGLATAYHLAELAGEDTDTPHSIHLVEPSPTLFASASGKAAGFLARDWFAPALAPLGALSFDLHRALAAEYNGRAQWGWSESISYSLDRDADSDADPDAGAPEPERKINDGIGDVDWVLSGASRATSTSVDGHPPAPHDDSPTWLRAPHSALQAISDRRSTGQVHPLQLCRFLLAQCQARGVTLHHPARATQLRPPDARGAPLLRLAYPASTLDVPCDSIVLAAGCWTPPAFRALFPRAPRAPRVTPLAGHSVVLRAPHWPPAHAHAPAPACHAVFTSDPAGFSPELFARAGGDVWLGGLNSGAVPLPALPGDAAVDADAVARLVGVARELCGAGVEVLGEGLCFRPVTPTGRPAVVRLGEEDLGGGVVPPGGVFVATGHGPWGISLSLGTGRVVAEMVLRKETSADVSGLAQW